MDFHAAQQVKTGENLHLGWRHVYWAPVPAGDSSSLAPLLRFTPSAVSGALRTGLIVASESAVRRWVTAGRELQPGH